MTASRVMPSRIPESIEGVWIWPVPDHEDVVAGAFGHLAFVVERGPHAAGLSAFDPGEDVVQVVERLDAGIDRVGVVSRGRGGEILRPCS